MTATTGNNSISCVAFCNHFNQYFAKTTSLIILLNQIDKIKAKLHAAFRDPVNHLRKKVKQQIDNRRSKFLKEINSINENIINPFVKVKVSEENLKDYKNFPGHVPDFPKIRRPIRKSTKEFNCSGTPLNLLATPVFCYVLVDELTPFVQKLDLVGRCLFPQNENEERRGCCFQL